jgi:hypothetical protein
LRVGERKSRRPEWLVADGTDPADGISESGTGPSTELGTAPSTGLGTGWRVGELVKTGTEGKRPVVARVAQQLRLIK